MITIFILALHHNGIPFDFQFLRIRDNRNAQVLGNLRANLCGIAIDCLTAGDDQIIVQVAQCACDGLGGSPGICAAQHTIRHQDRFVRAHGQRFT